MIKMAQIATCVTKTGGLAKVVLQKFRCSNYNIRPVVCCHYGRKPHIDVDSLPKQPKRPLNAYLDFYVSHMKELRENNKDVKLSDLVKICSKNWNSLDEDTKKEYEERSKARWEEYRQEMERFKESLTVEEVILLKEAKKQKTQKKKRKKEKKIRKAFGIPKRPMTPYIFFVNSKMPNSNKDTSAKDYISLLAKQWRQMSEAEKKPFSDLAEESRRDYEEKMAVWVEHMVDQGDGKEIEKSVLKKQLMKLGLPEKNKSPYIIYRWQNKKSKECPWSSLSADEKLKYVKLAEEDKVRYEMELEEWYEAMEDMGKLDYARESILLLKAKKNNLKKKKSMLKHSEDHDLSDSGHD